VKIGLIGDYDASITAHQAIPPALRLAADQLGVCLDFEWISTDEILDVERVSAVDGLWCVPGSPYRNMEGALRAIRFAREARRPFLGTCGGFQHAVVEYARNVLGWSDAQHAETTPHSARPVVTLLECSLVEATDTIILKPGSRIHEAYGRPEIVESYRCRYGLNQMFLGALTAGHLQVGAEDRSGDVRALELDDHPFYLMTLFQPERAALTGQCPPLVLALLRACLKG
jgi:CTP synthase (UTP-ammonia lyase)